MTLSWWHPSRSRLGVSTTLALCCALGAACNSAGSSDDTVATQGTAGAASGDAGASSESEPSPDSIYFVSLGGLPGLVLEPKQTQELTVQTVPPGIFLVHFALPGSGEGIGDPGDAALDRNESETDAEGVAHVVLTAPSTPAGFNVRASAGKQSGFQGVQVTSLGYTSLRVMPSYNGQRPVSWTATATAAAGVSCSQLSGNPPPDGKLIGVPSGPDEVTIARVPVGVDVVVTVRAGHYVGGCATLPPLSEGDGNTVLVYASDRPLNLAETHLSLEFGPSEAQPAFDKLLGASTSLIEDSLLGGATSDVGALLDAMRDATPAADRSAFTIAREQGGWDDALGSAFGSSRARLLRDPVDRWLKAGLASFDASNTFSGSLAAAGDDAVFKPSLIAGLSPSEAGFAKSFPATWSADSSDTLQLGTAFSWEPSRLVTALAVAPALLEFPAAQSLEEALAASVDCDRVGSVLLAHGLSVGSSLYDGCDASCGTSTCVAAISNAWSNAQDASASSLASLSVTATGSATVGDAAEIVKLDGTWVGELSDGDAKASVSGTLTASADAP